MKIQADKKPQLRLFINGRCDSFAPSLRFSLMFFPDEGRAQALPLRKQRQQQRG